MRSILTSLLVSVSLLTPIDTALAGPGSYEEIASQLNLNPDQQTKVEGIIYASKTARADIQARLEKARLELRHNLSADPLDEKAVTRAADGLSAATGELIKNRVSQALALRKVLSAEQFDTLEKMWRGRRGGDHGERGGDRLRNRLRTGDTPAAAPAR